MSHDTSKKEEEEEKEKCWRPWSFGAGVGGISSNLYLAAEEKTVEALLRKGDAKAN